MIKIKWLFYELPLSLVELSNLMKENQYSEGSSSGFLLSLATQNKLAGKYIEKIVQKSIVQDPFGEVTEMETTSYYICRFNLDSKSKHLYISEPPRSLRKFTNKLHKLTGLGLVLSEININPSEWVNEIEEKSQKFKITQISCCGIRASKDSVAKLAITGSNDVRYDFSKLIADKRYMMESIKFEAEFDNLPVKGELTRTGSCKIRSPNVPVILEGLRISLEKMNRS